MKLPIHYNVNTQGLPESQAVPMELAVGKTGKSNHQGARGEVFEKGSNKPFHYDAL